MGSGYVLQEDGAINGLVATRSKANKGTERCNGYEVRASGPDKAGHRGDEQSGVERYPSTNEVGRHGPKGRSDNQASILGDSQERDALDGKFSLHRSRNDSNSLHPELAMCISNH